ncbi:hypothetical protein DdX_03131 [Ditylenchus destructor]|uniref:Uncharacterized protein n=1 Tax=Ditylenchus destructor TaxID=166010 RepID=A0AAD4NJ87_9BILA|nr:hypothetical protein DdX_03131 [Ditylenchus destructor]
MKILRTIGHIWKNMFLKISCKNVNQSAELFQLISTCEKLMFNCGDSVLALQNFIPDTLTYIRLDDPNYSPVINSLPIDGIVNYLFSHNLTIKVKRLSINRHVGIPLNDQQCQYMVEEIKKRFLQEDTPVCMFHLAFQTSKNFHSMLNLSVCVDSLLASLATSQRPVARDEMLDSKHRKIKSL